jgi:CubicO group peptidase (beta-lactamase class C family)
MRQSLSLLCLFVAGAVQGAEPPASLKETVSPPVEKFVAAHRNAGLVVGVYQNGTSSSFGFGTVYLPGGEQTPTGETIFEIGSITKGFTGILLADAVRRGEVKLDAPAQEYLPPDLVLPKSDDSPITLGQLATHHSGLPVQPPLIALTAKDWANPYADFDRTKLAAMLPKLKPVAKPDAKYIYSNLGTGLVGHALVHAAKADSFNELLQARICRPLGLKNTSEALTGAQRARFARAHKGDGKPTSHWDFASLEACGGVRSCTNDLLHFAAAVLDEKSHPLTPAMLDAFKPRKELNPATTIGLFWMKTTRKGKPTMIWHNGSTYGHRSILLLAPDAKTAVIVLSAVAADEVDQLGTQLLDLLVPKPQAP